MQIFYFIIIKFASSEVREVKPLTKNEKWRLESKLSVSIFCSS